MQENDKNEFANWLFNQFVENDRKYGKEARIYSVILKKYAELGFPNENQIEEKKYAEKLHSIIGEALIEFNTHLLILRGKEEMQDYKERMERYIKRLQAIGHDEQSIIELIIKKLKLNYGNNN